MIQRPTGATEGSRKTSGSELNGNPTTQAFALRKHVKQEHIHTQVYLSFRASMALAM